jgi:amino acid transporter
VKRLLLGRPLATHAESSQRMRKLIALPIFAADAIASSAFATQEILHVLVRVAAAEAVNYLIPISLVVVVLLFLVVSSYRQTIFAYPGGGGSYVVSRENLGNRAGMLAAASLMVDYTLTVAVSIAAGTAAIASAVPPLRTHLVGVAMVLLILLTLVNLRGVKESGRLFAVPTYVYVGSMALLIGYGLFRSYTGSLDPLPPNQADLDFFTHNGALVGTVTAFLLARAFASGAIALSGVEAISNGISAFKEPQARNAATTLVWTGLILAALFTGIAVLTHRLTPTLSEDQTILSIMGRAVFGGDNPMYFILQAGTALILIFSANTAFAGFPRLVSIVAHDGYLPHQLANRGDRLVYSNGIIGLAVAAGVLLVGFGAVTTRLVPLFAVGLFLAFTLSQAGMVRHHLRLHEPGWRWKTVINAAGATATAAVLVVVITSKFLSGAWIPVLVIPVIYLLLARIHHHYAAFASTLAIDPTDPPAPIHNTVVVLIGRLHRGVPYAVAYAESLNARHMVAVTVDLDETSTERVEADWAALGLGVPLEVVPSPYRELTRPILDYIDSLDERWGDDVITVVIPEFVVHRWWEQLLHNQSALSLKVQLLFRRNTVVISVPCHIG